MTMTLLIASCGLSLLGALFSLLAIKHDGVAKVLGCTFGIGAALCALVAGVMAVFGEPQYLSWLSPWRFADFTILLNPLTGLLLVVINLLALMAWIYGYSYFDEYRGKGEGAICFFTNLFIVAMNLVCATDSAFWFLIFFEVMALTSYYLVVVSQTEQALHGGFMYFVMAHVGYVLIMIAFFIMAAYTGSWSFSDYRAYDFGPVASSFVFLLAFFGFGCKAGMFPTHTWLPMAHPQAPSNISALMSGAMVKIGIYGMLLFACDLLSSSGVQLWWGVVVLVIGMLSAVLGITYGAVEKDVKKLLAYCTVENIGIILMGVGVGLMGLASGNPVLASLGFMAACFHVLNHSCFKGLLFLGAGSLLYSTGTRDVDQMGGLIHLMPATALFFCIGAMAITAVPPLNGFASEWFVFQSMITAATSGPWWITLLCGLGVVALALTGAIAITAFVKAFGVAFLGKPRSQAAENAKEVPVAMLVPMGILTAICIAIALCASLVVPVMELIANSLGAGTEVMAQNIWVFNQSMDTALSLPVMAGLLLVLFFLAWLLRKLFSKGGTASDREVWQTGYMPDVSMQLLSTSVASEMRMFLRVAYAARDKVLLLVDVWNRCFHAIQSFFGRAQGWGDAVFTRPIVRCVDWISTQAGKVECGSYRWYVVYIVVGVVLFVILACVL